MPRSLTTAAALLSVLTACANDADDQATVLLIGDSIFVQSSDNLMLAMVQEGWIPVVDARGGTALEPGPDGFDWPPRVDELVDAVDPDAAVVELGSNDCHDAENLADDIDDVMAQLAGVDPVVWLNLPTIACTPSVSAQLRAATERWDDLELVDAAAHFEGHPEWIYDDGIHLSAAGEQELAEFVRDALVPHLSG